MELERRKAIDRAEAAGYLPHIRSLAQYPTKPLWWWRDSFPPGESILHNGTLCAIDTGKMRVCVTAGHVYSKYLADCKCFDDVQCQVGGVRVRLEDYVIDHDEEIDLATFDLSPILLAGSGIEVHCARRWPPERLRNSDIVVLGGYPGLLREEKLRGVESPFVSFVARVAQASEDHSAVQLNIEKSYWPDRSGGIPARSDLGGMSGGPILRYQSEPIELLEIVGFIYEASKEYELVFARHASCIDRTGHISGSA